eukprot:TRINITY_DN3451_c0_g1_i3.p1 TRINITY_DN3451_c0_g1~~TRINITY_DN3451_c0_g1_i3.p1  ORF type:complete len:182 (+),score=65.19 TRINITY_DN3451_c0_g1_i3:472-1017(+)
MGKPELDYRQYQVVGRAKPSEANPDPVTYRMKIFARNEVAAKSRFWYFINRMKKVKRSNGQLLAINEIFPKKNGVARNYGLWIRYMSRSGTHNMYKEYRATTINDAVRQMYEELASRHRARKSSIQIMRTAEVAASATRRNNTKQFHDSNIKFPLAHRQLTTSLKKYKTTFKASRPHTHFG